MEMQATNMNGFDPSEIRSRIADQMFKMADVNNDNGIDMTEFQAGVTKMGNGRNAEQMFAKIDTNGDGKIDNAESEEVLKKIGEKLKSRFANMRQNLSGAGNKSNPSSFDSLLAALQNSDSDNEDNSNKAESRISYLISEMQTSVKYGKTGSLNFSSGIGNSTFSLTA